MSLTSVGLLSLRKRVSAVSVSLVSQAKRISVSSGLRANQMRGVENRPDVIKEIAQNLAHFSSGFQNHKAYGIHVASNMPVLCVQG